ncbi:ribonuclease R [Halothermothrix orenii]|uniref:Ribonuclease R n=1 Tax=Halothermothrix orenii (strain H 168 / OCM 544 / DSM 9562) TaxID=373903 RepID=B8CYF3_HALOH|nr:ribonuclease R [Halothermothrix orenii]ACL70322.1 ribonuclease R [Halothermothrix orenii H 168]
MSARDKIMEFMADKAERPMSAAELMKVFKIEKDQKGIFINLLKKLVKEGLLFKTQDGKYGIPEKMDLIPGRIEGNPRGFAFLIPDDPTRDDIFISLENLKGAMHNDRVFVRLLSRQKGKNREGEVVKIIERANHQVVGNLEKSKYFGFVVPDNKRIFYDVFIPKEELNGARQNQKVVAEITRWPEKKRNPEGKIIKILGSRGERGVDIEGIIYQLGLPQEFDYEVLEEAKSIPLEISKGDLKGRRDLRAMPMVTIDGADAKDLDDAVSIEEVDDNQVRLGVHIADVSHYVKEDSALDREALKRGTSIYLVDRVIPMLPERLSNGICSLNPNQDRLTMSVFITYQLEPFKLMEYEIVPSVIKTNYRLTYDEVREILVHKNKAAIQKYRDFVPYLKLMNKLRKRLREERVARGSIDFDMPEVKVILNEDGKPVDIINRVHGIPEQLIEEFMIAANRVVAEDMYWRQIPFIYRVHDQPDHGRMADFNEFIHNFGYHLKGVNNEIHPRELQELLQLVEGRPEERLITRILLRSMKQAVYSDQNIGHFGLALDYYTHFTSPIRRYPDLMIHRIIKEVIKKGYLPARRQEELEEKLFEVAEHSSLQERKAMEAERDSVDLKKVEYMKDKTGEEYEGIINGVTNFGFFVELDNTVEGLIHVENLEDDYYHYVEEQHALIGERTRKTYRFGDRVRVRVERVNLDERQIDFSLIE